MKKSLLALSLAALATSAFAGNVYEHKDDNGSSYLNVFGDLTFRGQHDQELVNTSTTPANSQSGTQAGTQAGNTGTQSGGTGAQAGSGTANQPAATAPKAQKEQLVNFRARLGLKAEHKDQNGVGVGFGFRTSYNLKWTRKTDKTSGEFKNPQGWAGNGQARKVNLDYVFGSVYLGPAGSLSYGNRPTAATYFGDDLNYLGVQETVLLSTTQLKQTFLYTSPEFYGVKLSASYGRSNYTDNTQALADVATELAAAQAANPADQTKLDALNKKSKDLQNSDGLRTLQYAAKLEGYGFTLGYAHSRDVKKADTSTGLEGYTNDFTASYVNSTLVDGLDLGLGVNYNQSVYASNTANKEVKQSNLSGGVKVNYTGFQYAKPYAGVFAGRLTDATDVDQNTENAHPNYTLTVTPYVGFATTPVKFMDASVNLFVEGLYTFERKYTYDDAQKKYQDKTSNGHVVGAFGVSLNW